MDLDEMQEKVWENKLNKGFNITNVEKEFCYLYGEVGEAYEAYLKKRDDLGLELADIAIYLLGLSNMLGFSLKEQIEKKMEINKNRKYIVDEQGVFRKIDGEDYKNKNGK